MVVFDSAAEIGSGQAVYLIARAEVVPDDELEGCLEPPSGHGSRDSASSPRRNRVIQRCGAVSGADQ